jgi:hypothetical protein
LWSGILALLFIATRYLAPGYIDNETTYAIGPIRVLQPDFLAGHPWSPRINPFFAVFDTLVSPVYLALEPLTATIILRVLIWAFQIWALWRLFEALDVRWWARLLAVIMWVNVEQTLVAGEWVFGCTSAKPVSYGFVFLSLESLIRGRLRRSGLFAGIATSFHILVGGWAAAALGLAALLKADTRRVFARALAFGVPAALAALPGLIPAVLHLLTASPDPGGISAAESARIYVEIATPFHLNPRFFMTGLEPLKLLAYGTATVMLLAFLVPRTARAPLIAFLLTLAAFFTVGLAARATEQWSFLKYYPFRVADGAYPMFFWIGVALLLQRGASRFRRSGPFLAVAAGLLLTAGANSLNQILESPAPPDRSRRSLAYQLGHGEPRLSAYWLREKIQIWSRHLEGRDSNELSRMEDWIRAHTPADGVFLIPPWLYTFPLRAGRVEFMTFKSHTFDRMDEWLARWEALNGAPFRSVGWGMVQETRDTYSRLTADQVAGLHDRFGIHYVLTSANYEETFPTLHREGVWRLYALPSAPPRGD